ncbi:MULTISPECIES: entericidin A/B family lipoprotein [Oceanimonas]|nr:entericidin A/B family lipoprotein [Oceanimonas smirnovii]
MKLHQLVLCLTAALVLTGCNTFAGAGKDIERGGEVVQDAARDVQKKL